ncbi:MAG: hypothetical protein IPI66_02245 [Chitinophagaceae bacterium]|nr:hypothetical protein [Chitinophagaceae bacterium]MBL0054997.1 hypothetical protein [Chitinophagaceae bacterium]
MDTTELSLGLNKDLQLALPETLSYTEIVERLTDYFNDLVKHDFEKLVAYLYRIDVNEQKLRSLLQHFPDQDAGKIIAMLVIERQEEKIKSRAQFRPTENKDDEEEKW